jgi:transcriptional regulator with XRE-family HTH domain
MLDMLAIGHKIAALRKRENLSQEALAARLYVTRQAVSNWEVAKSAPTIDNILELSSLFGVSFEEILGLGEKTLFDQKDLFKDHERAYVLKTFLEGGLKVPLREIYDQATGEERRRILKALKEGRLDAPISEIDDLLGDRGREFLSPRREKP